MSLRSWFSEWPSEQLAQIYSGGDLGGKKFCGHTFQLGREERCWGRIFYRLKQSSLGESSRPISIRAEGDQPFQRKSELVILKSRLSTLLVRSGIWEVLFPPRLSPRLLDWVSSFEPQAIYCQGYSLAFAWLPVMLSKHLKIPICFQLGDDWPMYLYRDSLLSLGLRPVVKRAVNELIAESSMLIANSKRMAEEYAVRYGYRFVPIMMGDRAERFQVAQPVRLHEPSIISLLYSGNLGQGRWKSLTEVCYAAEALQREGYRIGVTAFASTVPSEAINLLKSLNNLQVLPPPAHDMLPAYLKGADILVLPETFNSAMANEIRLSISTKAHLYMMSERPILVYGSPLTGIVDYARREGWASVVDHNDQLQLMAALRQLIDDPALRQRLVERGIHVALKNHSESVIRKRFLAALKNMLSSSDNLAGSTSASVNASNKNR